MERHEVTAELDHAVLFVGDLGQAVGDFESIGFRVTRGGTHAGGLTSNAVIPFPDGTYLELLAFNLDRPFRNSARLAAMGLTPWILRGRTALDRRFFPRARFDEGCRDVAFRVTDMNETVSRLRRAGLRTDGPFPGERVRTDGTRLAWTLGMPLDGGLPFLIADVTDRALRVPSGDATRHPNGAEGVETVRILTGHVETLIERYRVLLAQTPEEVGSTRRFRLPNANLDVRHGPKPSITLRLIGSGDARPFDRDKAHGALLEWGDPDADGHPD